VKHDAVVERRLRDVSPDASILSATLRSSLPSRARWTAPRLNMVPRQAESVTMPA